MKRIVMTGFAMLLATAPAFAATTSLAPTTPVRAAVVTLQHEVAGLESAPVQAPENNFLEPAAPLSGFSQQQLSLAHQASVQASEETPNT